MIADTSFIIDVLRKDENAIEKLNELEAENKGFSISSVTIYELWVSMSQSDKEEQREILDIISSQPIHSLDSDSGKKAGDIQAELKENGQRIGHLDALIAGITSENDGKILTANEKEFERVKGLEVEDY